MIKPYDKLGNLTRIELRDVWGSESADFTPWLARPENLGFLGDSLGLDLELQGREQSVGPFKADILCKDASTDSFVLIENQIERTDHTHLGQLLTYASGLKAVAIIWIAARFTEEHRAALDWLNEVTNDRINFFGLEIELWKIGGSEIAPKFNVVCKPNDWSSMIAQGVAASESGDLSAAKLLQRDYWTKFAEYVGSRKSAIRATKPLPQHWMNIALGRSGTKLAAIASFRDAETESFDIHEIRAELVLYDTYAKTYFEQLEQQKDDIEKQLGEPLKWHNPPHARMCRIYLRRSANLESVEQWPEQHEWLLTKLEALHKVFAPRVKNLQSEYDAGHTQSLQTNEE